MPSRRLLAVPNVSEGTGTPLIDAFRKGFANDPVALLDEHTDGVHNRTVFTLAGTDAALLRALRDLACRAIDVIDITRQRGAHPRIGALDVCPIVWPSPDLRDDAREAAFAVAEQIGSIGLPVFLYGELASSPERRERSYFRRGGTPRLDERMRSGELLPDLGPEWPHPTAGAVLVTARAPLAAFNLELDQASMEAGAEIASELREAGGGLPGVRALAIDLGSGRTQISTNVHDPVAVPLRRVVEEVRRLAGAHGARPVAAEPVGLVPAAALDGYPSDVPIAGGDPHGRTLEARFASLDG